MNAKSPGRHANRSLAALGAAAVCLPVVLFATGCSMGAGNSHRSQLRDALAEVDVPGGSVRVNCQDVEGFRVPNDRESLLGGCFTVAPEFSSSSIDLLIQAVARTTDTTLNPEWSCRVIASDVVYCSAPMRSSGDSNANMNVLVSYTTDNPSEIFPSAWPQGADVGFAVTS